MRFDKRNLLLYAVTDRSWLMEGSLCDQVEKALKGGATFVQLREKQMDAQLLLERAKEIRELCMRYHVPFVVNDNVEVALVANADGVHVGQGDIKAKDARARLGPDKIIGVTARTVDQALRAQEEGADYLGAGAVFHTGTKSDARDMDHETFQKICESVEIPVVAIGGITRSNIMQLKGRKMSGFAVVSAIFAQRDIEGATRELRTIAETLVQG